MNVPDWFFPALIVGLGILVAIAAWDWFMDERERRRQAERAEDDDPEFFERLKRDMVTAADKYEKVRKGRVE